MMNNIKDNLFDFFTMYETPRLVLVKNYKLAIPCRIIQMGVLAYIIVWVFMYEKGYQITDTAISSVATKVKGVAYAKENGIEKPFEVSDYVFPDHGISSFVIMTNFISTKGQILEFCPEKPTGTNNCTTDADCKKRKFKQPGIAKCMNKTKTCAVVTWCPVEDDSKIPNPPLLAAAENFTLFIKNSIFFPEFQVVRSNLVEKVDAKYLKSCIYEPTKHPLCPIFRIGDIVKHSNFSFRTIAQQGAAIGIIIEWDCNLDVKIQKCKPKYKFEGLFGTIKGQSESASTGYNFRKAKHYVEYNIEKRTLTKIFGIRFEIIVHGEAGKFNIIPTLMNIGSGVGIFGVATVVCDLILLHQLSEQDIKAYNKSKFKLVLQKKEEGIKAGLLDKNKDELPVNDNMV